MLRSDGDACRDEAPLPAPWPLYPAPPGALNPAGPEPLGPAAPGTGYRAAPGTSIAAPGILEGTGYRPAEASRSVVILTYLLSYLLTYLPDASGGEPVGVLLLLARLDLNPERERERGLEGERERG